MNHVRRPALWWLVVSPLLAAASALVVAGCGSGSSPLSHSATRPASRSAAPEKPPQLGPGPIPAPPPTGTQADAAAVAVIKGWSGALRRGDVRAAAAYFARPSELLNGSELFTIHNLRQAEVVNETLPCGAKFVSADQRGRYVNALFDLTNRSGPGGGSCGSGAGLTARTNFLISHGLIVAWIRAPDDPGDNGTPAARHGPGNGAPVV